MKTKKKLCNNCGMKFGKNHRMPFSDKWVSGVCDICGGNSNGFVLDEKEFGYLDKSAADSVEFDLFHGEKGI